jgi:hypothetical protein
MDTQAYQIAKDALQAKDYKAAERAFKKTLDSIGDSSGHYSSVLSYYGLSQVLIENKNGLLMCRDAASNEVFEGLVFLNLACAEWYSDNRKRAIDAIRHGIRIAPNNQQLNKACAKLDCRKKCCFGFLPRSHKLNRLFGRMFRRPTEITTVHNLLY